MREPEDFEVFEVEEIEEIDAAAAEEADSAAVEPGPVGEEAEPEPTADSEPEPAADLPDAVYCVVPNPLSPSWLLAHDRHLVLAAIVSGDNERGLLGERPEFGAGQVVELERQMARRYAASRRRHYGQAAYLLLLAVGSPFLAASLLGALGLVIGPLPLVGDALGVFVESAGASVGGLPLAALVCSIPGIVLVTAQLRKSPPLPRLPRRPRLTVSVGGALDSGFLEAASDLVHEARALVGGRANLPQSDARRLAGVLWRLERLALEFQLAPVASAFADLAQSIYAFAAGPRGFGGRSQLRLRNVAADYDPDGGGGGSAWAQLLLKPVGGIIIAVILFAMAGVFRLANDQFEIVRTNSVWQPAGAIDYVDLTRQTLTGVNFEGSDAAIAVPGPGWFWAPPPPLTRREQISRLGNFLTVDADIGQAENDSVATVRARFEYLVKEPRAFVDARLRYDDPDVRASAAVAALVTSVLAREREELELTTDASASTELLRDNMAAVLDEAVSASTEDEILDELGVLLVAVMDFELGEKSSV